MDDYRKMMQDAFNHVDNENIKKASEFHKSNVETRDILKSMLLDSAKETKYQHRFNIYIAITTALTLIVSVASLVLSLNTTP